MASERTAERIASWIQRKVATMLLRDLQDPRAAFITVTRVKISRDLETATVYYSVLGDDAERSKAAHLLERARPFIRREVAKGLHTRTAPDVGFEYDEAIAGTLHMTELLDRLARERASREASAGPDFPTPSEAPGGPSSDSPPRSEAGPSRHSAPNEPEGSAPR
ncbi:MAG TPA: 30S ribosome-binding factor RbfA [Planctomycetota bacterium]|nr:30S ribosome-binding factor RbfA [Planctomycetota bacterium]